MKFIIELPQIWRIFLFIILMTAFAFALYGLIFQLIFGYDQARDAWEAYAIWHDLDIKIIGPGTDISGIYHGALWYYFLAIPYSIYHHPLAAGITVFVLSFLTIPLCGLLAYRIFKDIYVSAVAMALYSVSPLFQVFSRWVSNPVLSVIVAPLLLLYLWKYSHRPTTKDAAFIGIFLGLIIQSDFAYIIFCLFIPVYLLLFRVKPSLKDIIAFIIAFTVSMGTFILAEIKFRGRTITALLEYLQSHSGSTEAGNVLLTIGNKLVEFVTLSVLPFPLPATILAAGLFIFLLIKEKIPNGDKKGILFLIIWCGNIIFFSFFRTGISQSTFVYAPSFLALIILASYIITKIIKERSVLLLLLVILSILQLSVAYDYLARKFNPMSAQQRIFYQDSQQVIDTTYTEAKGQQFSVNSVTNPLYINTTWSYLYEFYGKKKYGYIPSFKGRDQSGYLGRMPQVKANEDLSFLIIEPKIGIPESFITEAVKEEDLKTRIVSEKFYGEYILQKRQLKK